MSVRCSGIYVRISDDKAEDGAGIGRQEQDCRELAKRQGWEVAEVYVENDTSAFKRRSIRLPDGTTALRVVRPAFRRLLDDLATGAIDAVVGYDLDRVARDPRDLEDLIDVVESRGVPTRAVTGSLDLSTDAGITMARVMVAVANKSSRDTARRVARKHEELAETGRVGGGGIRAFGYERDGMTVRESEASVVRELARRVIAGESTHALARWLTETGVPTVQGGARWNPRSVHSVVTKPRNAGLRSHRGEVVGPAVWPAILDREIWEQVCVVMQQRAGGSNTTLVHWLTGILLCGHCGRALHGAPGGKRGPRYWCATPRGGCGRIAVDAAKSEALVEDLLLAYLARPDVLHDLRQATGDASGEAARREAQTDEAQLRELAEMWGSRSITTKEYMAARRLIEERLSVAQKVMRAAMPGAVHEILAGDLQAVWATSSPSKKREIARTVFADGVRVEPATQSGLFGFDERRLQPVGWVGGRG